jgi:hypothetical protein
MAKLSVYVPDDLLEQVKAIDPSMRPSAILQDALRATVDNRRSRPYARLSPELERDREAAQRIVLERVAEAYDVGYRAGLAFAQFLPWNAFEDFAASGWNLRNWSSDFDDSEYDNVMATDAERAAGDVVLDFAGLLREATSTGSWAAIGDRGMPSGVTGEAFVDAIRDLWTGPRDLPSSTPEGATGVVPTDDSLA